MKHLRTMAVGTTAIMTAWAAQAVISGNPLNDGWVSSGNSLDQGTYVTGSANYGYETYGAGFYVDAGSSLQISDGTYSWDVGDAIIGVGGIFQAPTDPGWPISGTSVNSLLSTSTGPKLQAKFGTESATWYTSSAAPGGGNGSSGSSAGGGRVQVRTSGWFGLANELYSWSGNSGQLLVPEDGHVLWRIGSVDKSVDERIARMIWNYDATTGEVGSWELLLNVTLLRELNTGYSGLLPDIGDNAIMTVQNGESAYTDALVNTTSIAAPVPEPSTYVAGALLLLPFGASVLRRMRNNRKE